jgi:Predicted integral membrane protein (DUF2269)
MRKDQGCDKEEPEMSTYTLELFLHVSGAIGVFAGAGTWLFGLTALRRARRVEQVRAIAWLIIVTIPFMVLSLVLVGAAGIEMAISTWGLQTPWIIVSLVSLALFAPINVFVLDPRMRELYAKAGEEPDGPLSDELVKRTHDPILGTVAQTLATVLLGIVFLMTNKPSLTISIMVMVIALVCGLLSGVPYWAAARRWTKGRDVLDKSALYSSDRASEDPFLRKTLWTRRW